MYSDICKQIQEAIEQARRESAQRIAKLEDERDALKAKVQRQRRELRRLNKYLGPYWSGFRSGIDMESARKLRAIMNATFGHRAVRAAEIAAIDAAKDGDDRPTI